MASKAATADVARFESPLGSSSVLRRSASVFLRSTPTTPAAGSSVQTSQGPTPEKTAIRPFATAFAEEKAAEQTKALAKRSSQPENRRPSKSALKKSATSIDRPTFCGDCGMRFRSAQPYFHWAKENKILCQTCLEPRLPSLCSTCSAVFMPGQPVYRCTTDRNKFACEKCAYHKMAQSIPRRHSEAGTWPKAAHGRSGSSCSSCTMPVVDGQKVFATDNGLILCFICWEKVAPKCGRCGEPASGSVARFGGKVYHSECFRCEACQQRIQGHCALGPAGLFCAPCKESITAQVHEIKDCMSTGNAIGAAQIAECLFQTNGIKIPGLPEAKCVVCAEALDSELDKNHNGFMCTKCIGHVSGSIGTIKTKEAAPESEASFHRSCYSCGGAVSIEDGELCSTCREQIQDLCHACKQPLGSVSVNIHGKRYHSACLYCCVCSELIISECTETDNGLLCTQCLELAPAENWC